MTASAEPAPERRGERRRTIQRRVIKEVRRALMKLGLYTVPYLYLAYMWLVYRTSRVEELGFRPDEVRERFGRAVFALWHDEVFFVAWSFGKYRPDTLASQGDGGEIITRMLELCHFNVFRGGSSTSERRRAVLVVKDMIAHMRSHPGVIYGITTDGSTGPVYRMKRGVITIAAATGAPLCVEKTWCRRYLRLPTWDRSLVPLPFNHIVHVYAGPIWPPSVPSDAAQDALRAEVEHLLCRVTAYARARVEGTPLPADWLALFPPAWRDEMARAEEPELFLSPP